MIYSKLLLPPLHLRQSVVCPLVEVCVTTQVYVAAVVLVLLEEVRGSKALKTATRAVAQVNDHGEGVLTEAEKVQEGVEATRANDNIKEMCPVRLLKHPMLEVRKCQWRGKEEFGAL